MHQPKTHAAQHRPLTGGQLLTAPSIQGQPQARLQSTVGSRPAQVLCFGGSLSSGVFCTAQHAPQAQPQTAAARCRPRQQLTTLSTVFALRSSIGLSTLERG